MNRTLAKPSIVAAVTACVAAYSTAAIANGMSADVVHFWISKSESAALNVLREDWEAAGNQWIDLPNKDKVSVQRVVSERIVNGYAPTVMQWNANEGSRELPEMGIVNDIEAIASADHWRDVLPPAVINRITYRDKIYFAPTNIHAENWLWTSLKIFDKVGLGVPTTWDEILEAAAKIDAAGYLPIAVGGGHWEISLIFNNIMFHKLGAEGYARIISGDATMVDDPRMLEALEILRQLSTFVEPASVRKEKSWADATTAVGRGEAAMQFMGDWAKGELIAHGFEVDKDFSCNLVPGTAIAYFMVIDAFAFPLANREGAVEAQHAFARMALDRDNQVAFSRIKGSLPARTDIDPSGLDRCGQLGVKLMIEQGRGVSAQSMAMPTQMSEGWIAVLADFFEDQSLSAKDTQGRLRKVLMQP